MKKNGSDFYPAKRKREAPPASAKMASSVSQYRRGVLEQEIDQGKFSTGETGSNYEQDAPSVIGSGLKNIIKQAESFDTSGALGGGWRGSEAGGTVRQAQEVYSPLWLNSNLNLPRDRATINAWIRSFFALNPIVQNAISLHSTYPIAKLNIKCKNKQINDFFENMNEEIGLMNFCCQVAQEYWCIGEVFPFAELDESSAKWSRLVIHNPDYIDVKRGVVASEPLISLRPDENLKRMVKGNRPSDIQQRQQLDPSIIEHVRRGENIPLSNFYVSHLARRISPYDVRGTGLPVSCFRQLMLFDQLRESKFAQAANMINPLTLVKVGAGGDNYKPLPEDLEKYRQLFEQANFDKDFKIFTTDAVTVEKVGSGAGIYDIGGDITQLLKEIYIGLMVPQVIMDGGADVTYANGGVSLDVLRQRYMQFRNMLSAWLRKKIFAPISKINDFYERTDKQKVLIVPEIEWNHMSLFDMGDYIQNLSQLLSQEPRKVSLHTLYRSLGLEYEDEMRNIRRENIQSIVQAKEMEALQRMGLNDLRSIGEDDEVQEITENPLPGEQTYDAASGGMPGGMPGGIGGMPPMGGMGGMGDMGGGLPPPPGGLGGPPSSGPGGI